MYDGSDVCICNSLSRHHLLGYLYGLSLCTKLSCLFGSPCTGKNSRAVTPVLGSHGPIQPSALNIYIGSVGVGGCGAADGAGTGAHAGDDGS